MKQHFNLGTRVNPNIGAGTGRCEIVFSYFVSNGLCIDNFYSTHKGMTMVQRFLSVGHLSAMFFCLATRRFWLNLFKINFH